MEVIIINSQKDVPINENYYKEISEFIFKKLEKEKNSELNIVFIGRDEIRDLNLKYRNIDSETDVLSFSYKGDKEIFDFMNKESGANEEGFKQEYDFFTVGEILICPLVAKEKLKDYDNNWNLEKLIIFLIIHGMLHIYGYDHENEEDSLKMEAEQEKLMKMVEREFNI